jgi:poly(A) polymerase
MAEPILTHLTPQPWMKAPETRAVLAALGGGESARFVGGAVRDALLGRAIGDIDIATPLPPETVMERLAAAGIKPVPSGLAHGSVTAVIGPQHFEITTLRRDVETYGRHARVEFSADWAADAARRDFTMNALFMDAGGAIFDYVGGLEDLRARRVRFVGAAEARIREDVLRLLRFYRFYAHYGVPPADDEARVAAQALAPLLPNLSGERVAAELLKLLGAPDPVPTLVLMRDDGVLAVLLPEAGSLDRLAALVPLEPAPDALRRLAALVEGGSSAVTAIAARLKLSSAQRERLTQMAAPPWPVDLAADEPAQRRALYHLGSALYRDLALLRAAELGNATQLGALLGLAAAWRPVALPVQGRDVTALGMSPGPVIGRLLAELEAWWEAGDFRADRAQCLAELARRVAAG